MREDQKGQDRDLRSLRDPGCEKYTKVTPPSFETSLGEMRAWYRCCRGTAGYPILVKYR